MPELTPQQLADRFTGLGSTDVVEVCGLAPWEDAGPWRVYNLKTGVTPPSEPTEEMRWGHRIERTIALWYVDHVGPFEVPTETTRDPIEDWLFATLDGITPERTIEVKNVSGFMAKHWDPTDPDGVPHYVRAQVQIGMRCSGRTECHVVAGLAGRPPEIWTVRYDSALADMLVKRGRAFWHLVSSARATLAERNLCIQNGTTWGAYTEALKHYEPAIDASDACREYLRKKYPKDERGMLDLEPAKAAEFEALGCLRSTHARTIKSLEAEVRQLDTIMLARIGPHAGYECDSFKMTWKVDKNGTRRSRFTPREVSDE